MRAVSKPAFLRHVLRKLRQVGLQALGQYQLCICLNIEKHVCWPSE